MDWSSVLALMGTLGGLTGVAALVQARAFARKADVETLCQALKVVREENERLAGLIGELERDNADLRRRVSESDAEISRLQALVSALLAENAALKQHATAPTGKNTVCKRRAVGAGRRPAGNE